jgi:seryl-tRNA synthetase
MSRWARDTDIMEAYTRSDVTWVSHATEIERIKRHINKLGGVVSQLQAARDDASKQHQVAIDRILPNLQELASNTQAIIDHLNQTQSDLQSPNYQDYLRENANLAKNILQVVSDTVAYDSTKDKLEKLQAKLGGS